MREKDVSRRWRDYTPVSLPIHSLCFVFAVEDVSFQCPTLTACLLFAASFPAMMDPYLSRTINQNKLLLP